MYVLYINSDCVISNAGHIISPPSEEQETEKRSLSRTRVLAIAIVISTVVLLASCGIGYIFYKKLVNRRGKSL